MMEQPPATVEWDKLWRNVLIEKPKVTRFQNPWDSSPANPSPFDASQGEMAGTGGGNYMLDSAPVPPPVQKAQGQIQGDGMEVDASA